MALTTFFVISADIYSVNKKYGEVDIWPKQ